MVDLDRPSGSVHLLALGEERPRVGQRRSAVPRGLHLADGLVETFDQGSRRLGPSGHLDAEERGRDDHPEEPRSMEGAP